MKNKVIVFAGPCAVENKTQIDSVCKQINKLRLSWVRAGAYKPRLSPHSFQGLGQRGLTMLKNAAVANNLWSVTEVIDEASLKQAIKNADAIQIGTRNMTNYSLLKLVGQATKKNKKMILFKRGMSAKISEWLSAAEYISDGGNKNIMLCERGLRTFEDSTRFTLDISAVPVLHKQSKYPVCVDVSHAAGNADLVPSLAKAAVAAGADAIMLEVHPNPKSAKCDGSQQLNLKQFSKLINELRELCSALGKELV